MNAVLPKAKHNREDTGFETSADAVAHLREAVEGFPLTSGGGLVETPPPLSRLDKTVVCDIAPVSSNHSDEAALWASSQPTVTGERRGHRFPAVGETFLGFELREVLGTGAFAQVYLAHQVELADRPVALKVTTRPTPEPQRLARLRHTNIVPIHSVHDRRPLQAVCMPFLGRCTLADVLDEYREQGVFPRTSAHMASTAAMVATTQVSVRSTAPAGIPVPSPVSTYSAPTDLPSQVDLVLWVLARLADGLAHAHDRGILHLDLKPANVLLADDGQPLLLDFNLSYDVRLDDRPKTGGTLPYMAPEQLEEYRDGGATRVDNRTDLFALGVIAFELLTGRKPFPVEADKRRDLTGMVQARNAGPFAVRPFNADVSPAVEAIVLKLLHPNPDGRYQTARDVVEDLDCHAKHLPLKHAVNTSVVERLGKWKRRNPKAPLVLALAALVLLAGGAGAAAYRQTEARRAVEEDRARAAAVTRAQDVRDQLAVLRVDLTSRDFPKTRADARERGREKLLAYGLPGRADWATAGAVTRLSDEARVALTNDLGELALLMAHSAWLDGRGKSEGERVTAAEQALEWNRIAEECFVSREAPVAVAIQRRKLTTQAGIAEDGQVPEPGDTAIDLFLRGIELIAAGQFKDATGPLEKLTMRSPDHYGGQFCMGVCLQEMGDSPAARERYRMAQALSPTDYRAPYNRGVVLRSFGKIDEAEVAFTEAIARDPKYALSYQHRASVRLALGKPNYQGAIEDLTTALTLETSPVKVRYMRARAYRLAGNTAAAEQDLAAAQELTPTEAFDFLYRGLTRLDSDPKAALADFEQAAVLEPLSVSAWQNQAHVHDAKMHDPLKALAAQERAVEAAPEFAKARSGRAVLYARAGRRDEAHKDAQRALVLSSNPLVTYEASCVYALTAATHPEDFAQAEGLFRKALNDKFRDFKHIETDPDMAVALKRPEFRDAIAAAKVLGK